MEKLQYLLNNAQLQDSLLQSYRQISLTLQSMFLLIGTVLVTTLIFMANTILFYALGVLFLLVFALSMYAARKFSLIIKRRGNDVNFWHKKIIECETQDNSEMTVFSEFKLWQKKQGPDAEYIQNGIILKQKVRTDMDKLIEKGMGHTRIVIDRNITFGIVFVWIVLTIIAAGKLVLLLLDCQ